MDRITAFFLTVLLTGLSLSALAQVHEKRPDSEPRMLFSLSDLGHVDGLPPSPLTLNEKRSRIARLLALTSENKLDFSGQVVFNLFDDVEYVVHLSRKKGTYLHGMEVWTGRATDTRFDHWSHYTNVLVVVNHQTGKIVASILTDKGDFQILPTGSNGAYRIRDLKTEPMDCREIAPEDVTAPNTLANYRTVCGSDCVSETDENGNYVIDVFMGYSDTAAAVVGDINAHALSLVETVNTGLTNSLVTTTYLRLVGTGTTVHNPGIVTSVLTDCYTWFAAEIEELGVDLVGVAQMPTGAPNEQGGWGGIGGYSNVIRATLTSAFRHEVGHNAGGGHCPPGNGLFPYAHGYDNGNWKTHLCGNSVNYYSNPDVLDNQGNPIGQPDSADMARTWTERAHIMAQKRFHRVEYHPGDTCLNQICLPYHAGSQNELIKRVVFNTIDNDQVNPGWNCPSITGYSDYTHLNTEIHRNSTYTITVTPNFSYSNSKVGIWIDWDANGLLSLGERVGNFSGNGPWSTAVTAPANAELGPVRLRIRLQFSPTYDPHPCNPSGYVSGETEDYTVIVALALPITLIDFKGQKAKQGNLLTWETAEEVNASHFEVEHSPTATAFATLGQVQALGDNSGYNFLHNTTDKGVQFYRLKMVDLDGSYQYSKIVSVFAKGQALPLSLYPNPTSGMLTLRMDGEAVESGSLEIFNVFGQKVFELPGLGVGDGDEVELDIRAFPPGVYSCLLRYADGRVAQGQVVRM
jgi:hypothetical protein